MPAPRLINAYGNDPVFAWVEVFYNGSGRFERHLMLARFAAVENANVDGCWFHAYFSEVIGGLEADCWGFAADSTGTVATGSVHLPTLFSLSGKVGMRSTSS